MRMPLDRRLQILLDEERYEKVLAVATAEKRSVASVIRDAIDRALPTSKSMRRAAADGILAAEPVDVPSITQLRAELDELHGRHG